MTTSDHPDEPDFRDKNTATGRFSEVVCVRAGRVRLVLPEPGSALLQFVKLTGQFRRVIVWRDDPLVIKGVERLQLEHSQWPWHLLQDSIHRGSLATLRQDTWRPAAQGVQQSLYAGYPRAS